MQVFGLQREVYRAAKLDNSALSSCANERRKELKNWVAHRAAGSTVAAAAAMVERPRSTLYRWKARQDRFGSHGLEPCSRAPKRKAPQTIRANPELRAAVERLRREHPECGKATLGPLLRSQGYKLSDSSVGRILGDLKRRGVIRDAPVIALSARKKRRSQRAYAVRRPVACAPALPGELVQLDTLSVTVQPGFAVKQFTAVDYVSRFAVADVVAKATAASAAAFLDQLLARMPFLVRALQIDGGSEFMADFESACQQRKITLYVLPPRSPNQNGRVERLNGTYRYGFYEAYLNLPDSLAQLRPQLHHFTDFYNFQRPHHSLDFRSPNHYLQQLHRAA